MAYKITLKRPNDKESVLQIRFSKNGVPFKFYSGKTIQTKNWDDEKQLIRKTEENFIEKNNYIEDWEKTLRTIIEKKESLREQLNREEIQNELDTALNKKPIKPVSVPGNSISDFISFYDHFIEIHQHYNKPTLTIFKQNRKFVICAFELATKKDLKEYNAMSIKQKGKCDLRLSKKLPFDQVNDAFFQKFTNYLNTAKYNCIVAGVDQEMNYKKNYIGKQLKNLKQVVRASFKKYVKEFDLREFKPKFEEVDSIYTDFNELQNFVDLHLVDREKIVRDKYVLNCFLGMRFGDLSNIKPHHFKDRLINGVKYKVYSGRQIKTDNRVEFPLDKNAIKILEEYNYDIPVTSESEFNRVIKVVAKKAGLTQLFTKRETRGLRDTVYNDIPKNLLISSHSGRRSFCTNYYQSGWAIGSIMAVSGHKTEQEFKKYVKAGVKLDVLVNLLHLIPELKPQKKNVLHKVA